MNFDAHEAIGLATVDLMLRAGYSHADVATWCDRSKSWVQKRATEKPGRPPIWPPNEDMVLTIAGWAAILLDMANEIIEMRERAKEEA